MIHIDRSKVERPAWFGSPEWEMRQADLMEFLSASVEKRTQRRLEDILGALPKVVHEAVAGLFESRCAMCETVQPSEKPHLVRRFRPLFNQESEQPYAYTFAALLWENLILVCHDCDRAWGSRFPVIKKAAVKQPRNGKFQWDFDYNILLNIFEKLRLEERPGLVDPTADQPGHFLCFDANGLAEQTKENRASSSRGQQSIDMFQLNRDRLLSQRQRVLFQLPERTLTGVERGGAKDGRLSPELMVRRLDKLGWDRAWQELDISVAGQYQGCRASTMARWLYSETRGSSWSDFQRVLQGNTVSPGLFKLLRLVGPYYEGIDGSLVTTPSPVQPSARKGDFKPKANVPVGATIRKTVRPTAQKAKAESKPLSFSRKRVTEVKLQNFRHFTEATFTLPRVLQGNQSAEDRLRALVQEMKNPRAPGESVPSSSDPLTPNASGWKMLLGNNGTGKSSVLQAIAMALRADVLGQEALKEKMIADLPHSVSAGQTEGFIEVWIEDRAIPIRLDFTTMEVMLTGAIGDDPAQAFGHLEVLYLRGYGATRLLPPRVDGQDGRDSLHTPPQEIQNLFDPYHPLVDAEAWLQSIPGTEAQFQAFVALKDLLNLPAFSRLDFREWHGRQTLGLVSDPQNVIEGSREQERFTPLEYFSAGYQAMVALGCDIMAGFGPHSGEMRQRTGVVLLDEIGTNLHPSWRLRVVQALRRTFPLLQFIASTHEPLCLRGLGEGEVCLLTLDEHTHQVTLRDDLPSPAIYRVDQLLTGEFFGLNTAYDPHEEEAFDLYHDLLVKERGQGLSKREKEILADLRGLLKGRLVVGNTTPERHVMKALEEAMRQSNAQEPARLTGSPDAVRQASELLRALPGTSPQLKN